MSFHKRFAKFLGVKSINPFKGLFETNVNPAARMLRAGKSMKVPVIDTFRVFVGNRAYIEEYGGFPKLKGWFGVPSSPKKLGLADWAMLGLPILAAKLNRFFLDIVWHGKTGKGAKGQRAGTFARIALTLPFVLVGVLFLALNAAKYLLGVVLTGVSLPLVKLTQVIIEPKGRKFHETLKETNFQDSNGDMVPYKKFLELMNRPNQTTKMDKNGVSILLENKCAITTEKPIKITVLGHNGGLADKNLFEALIALNISNCLRKAEDPESALSKTFKAKNPGVELIDAINHFVK